MPLNPAIDIPAVVQVCWHCVEVYWQNHAKPGFLRSCRVPYSVMFPLSSETWYVLRNLPRSTGRSWCGDAPCFSDARLLGLAWSGLILQLLHLVVTEVQGLFRNRSGGNSFNAFNGCCAGLKGCYEESEEQNAKSQITNHTQSLAFNNTACHWRW